MNKHALRAQLIILFLIFGFAFFTDDDLDSVPNALDRYPGENDFSYITFEDINENGINDAIELR